MPFPAADLAHSPMAGVEIRAKFSFKLPELPKYWPRVSIDGDKIPW